VDVEAQAFLSVAAHLASSGLNPPPSIQLPAPSLTFDLSISLLLFSFILSLSLHESSSLLLLLHYFLTRENKLLLAPWAF
jgi:hypothetical protein